MDPFVQYTLISAPNYILRDSATSTRILILEEKRKTQATYAVSRHHISRQ